MIDGNVSPFNVVVTSRKFAINLEMSSVVGIASTTGLVVLTSCWSYYVGVKQLIKFECLNLFLAFFIGDSKVTVGA